MAAKFKEFLKKYGKVGVGVHCSVSAASITGLYIAIKNNVDVESILEKVGMPSLLAKGTEEDTITTNPNPNPSESDSVEMTTAVASGLKKDRNRTAELAASSGGALALAVLINKALLPVRVPITLALTRPVARLLVKRNTIKNNP